jgi:hypothetical protein
MDEPTRTEEKRKIEMPPWMLGLLTGVVGLVLGLGIGLSVGGEEPAAVAAVDTPSATPTGLTEPESPSPDPDPVYDELTAQDLELSLRTIERDCFGSAGGLETVRINAAMDQSLNLDPDVTWDVTYEIRGDEEGPLIGTFSIYPDGQYDVNDEVVGTPTCNTKITVKIVAVDSLF